MVNCKKAKICPFLDGGPQTWLSISRKGNKLQLGFDLNVVSISCTSSPPTILWAEVGYAKEGLSILIDG